MAHSAYEADGRAGGSLQTSRRRATTSRTLVPAKIEGGREDEEVFSWRQVEEKVTLWSGGAGQWRFQSPSVVDTFEMT